MRRMDQWSYDGSNPAPITNISKDEKARAHFLENKGNDEANQESSIRNGGNTKEKMRNKYKKAHDLKPSEETSGSMKEKKQDKKRKRKDSFLVSEGGEDSLKKKVKEASGNTCKVIDGDDAHMVPSSVEEPKNKKKKVTFSDKIEVFPLTQSSHKEFNSVNLSWSNQFSAEDESNLVWGKRFSPEEDELIRKATNAYIEENQLGEQGLYMILHCSKFRKQVKGCWKAIGSALPWRPIRTIYLRTHSIFEKNGERKWEPEEFELLKRFHAQHGPNWKKFADVFGKSRLQIKDTYRMIKAENLKKGKWDQVEYQALFDLVNLDLRLKAFQEKKKNHLVLKNNIAWESISAELSTRGPQVCCIKWYLKLTSSMVKEGLWSDLDDYKMIDAIQKTDPSCFEDVDWDNLLENRSGEICRKRWYQMIKCLDRFWTMPFVEQIDLLSQRYCPDMVPYMQKNLNISPSS